MYIVIFVTCANIKEAQNIAYALVKEKLAACVNIVNGIQSIFWWENKIDRTKEVLLIIKTKKSLFKKITAKVNSLHSYQVPEMISLSICDGNKDYLGWIDKNTK